MRANGPESRSAVISRVRALLDEYFGGRGPTWFYEHKLELEADGFPKRDTLIGGWNRIAVEAWFAGRAGVDFPQVLTPTSDPQLKRRLEALCNGENQRAPSS